MSTVELDTLLGVDAPGDAELIPAVRDGDTEAYGELFARHAREAEHEECEWAQDNLGAYIRGGCSRRDSGKAEAKGGANGKDARPGKR